MTVWRNAGPRCPSTSPPGPWRLIGQSEERGVPMAPPALLDGQSPPWWFYGCHGCCCGCRGLPQQNKWVVMANLCMVPSLLCHPHPPLPPPPCWWQVLHSSTRGRADSSWTGCCRRRDPSTDVQSTPSSVSAFSRASQPDTRSTGLCVCVCVCVWYTWAKINKIWIKIWASKRLQIISLSSPLKCVQRWNKREIIMNYFLNLLGVQILCFHFLPSHSFFFTFVLCLKK